MSDSTTGQKPNEETFHAVIEANPETIPFFIGKKLLRHEFRVDGKYIDFVLKDSAYHYLVEMKYRRDPVEAIIDLNKKAPLFARQEGIHVNKIKEVILVDRQSYEDKKQELRYHKDKGIICLIYDPDELLHAKTLSSQELALGRYETYLLKPLQDMQEEIAQIRSGKVYLGNPRRYARFESYSNFIISHSRNIAAIASAFHGHLGEFTFSDIPKTKKVLTPILSMVNELLKEYKRVVRCEPFPGFENSHDIVLDFVPSVVNSLVPQAIQFKQRIKEGKGGTLNFKMDADEQLAKEYQQLLSEETKRYLKKTRKPGPGCAVLVGLGLMVTLIAITMLILLLIK